MKSYLLIIAIVVLMTVSGMFSLWPNIIEAHYGGFVACPLISMDDSFGCHNMNMRVNELFVHISDFFSMISAILIGGVFARILLFVAKRSVLRNLIKNLYLQSKIEFKIYKFFSDLSLIAEYLYIISSGLRRGIINTKVF